MRAVDQSELRQAEQQRLLKAKEVVLARGREIEAEVDRLRQELAEAEENERNASTLKTASTGKINYRRTLFATPPLRPSSPPTEALFAVGPRLPRCHRRAFLTPGSSIIQSIPILTPPASLLLSHGRGCTWLPPLPLLPSVPLVPPRTKTVMWRSPRRASWGAGRAKLRFPGCSEPASGQRGQVIRPPKQFGTPILEG